jgi:hypothetical protein
MKRVLLLTAMLSFSIYAASTPYVGIKGSSGGAGGGGGGDLSGNYPNPIIANGAVTNAKVSDTAAIVDTKLATISTVGKIANTALSATVALTSNVNVWSATQTFNVNAVINGTLTGTAIGTTAGKLVALDGSAKLPAVDGSALTALTAANITAGGTLPALNGAALTNLPAAGGGNAVYGGGCDGALDFSGTTTPIADATYSGGIWTMTRDILASSINIATGKSIKTAGFRLFCTGTITFNGTAYIYAPSTDGGADGTAGTTPVRKMWGGDGSAGGAGQTTNGANATGLTGSIGGAGGNGGHGNPGNGGNGGSENSSMPYYIGADPGRSIGAYYFAGTFYGVSPGAGGGGGGGDGAVKGGGGGGGGSALPISSKLFLGVGTSGAQLRAKGGNGGSPASGNSGGGGGGGGGAIIITTSTALPDGVTTDVSGGTGGTHTGAAPAADGSNGSVGNVILIIN